MNSTSENAPSFPVPRTISALKNSIADGSMAHIYGNLTGGVFLPALALTLNASPLQIGILASLPLFATLAQLAGAYLVEHAGKPGSIALWFSFGARAAWLPLILFSFLYSADQPELVLQVLFAGIALSHLLGAVGNVSWISWMAELVPESVRGRFFGLRNGVLSLTTVIITIGGGLYLDWFKERFAGLAYIHAFELLLILAVVAGFLSCFFMARMPDLPAPGARSRSIFSMYKAPLRDRNFRYLALFAFFRIFATSVAGPFFIIYLLTDLKLDYTTVAFLTVISAMADLVGMWVWGHISDEVGNRPIILISAMALTILPLFWVFTGANDYSTFLLIPILHFAGGFLWAGYNLCTVNLVFSMTPGEGKPMYFAFWAVLIGVGSGLGALLGGLIANNHQFIRDLLPFTVDSGYKINFVLSALLRLIPFGFIFYVRDPQSTPVRKTMRILMNVRTLNSMVGFQAALQFFLPHKYRHETSSPYWPMWGKRDS